MQLRHWQASLGKWRRAAKGYLPALVCVGRALLEAALARIGERDVVLSAFSSNAAALGFYEHMGFGRTGVTFDEGSMEETEPVLRHKGCV